MTRLNMAQMPSALITELARLDKIGDIVGSVDTFAHLPTINDVLDGTGVTPAADVVRIYNHDLIVVTDASADGHGQNAVYEAATGAAAGGAVTWSFTAPFNITVPPQKARTLIYSGTVPDTIGTPPALGEDVKDAFVENNASVEVYVNGILEKGIQIDAGTYELELTGYTADGWTSSDIVDVYAWQ